MSTGIATLLWGNLLLKWRRFGGHPRDRAQRANILALFFVATAMTVLNPPVYAAIDAATDVPNIARLLGNSAGLIGAWAFEPVASELSTRGHSTRRFWESGWLLLAVLVTMMWLFIRADLRVSAPDDFGMRYVSAPYMGEYRVLLLGYAGLSFFRLFLLWARRLDPATRRLGGTFSLRYQFRLQTFGWLFGTLYCVQECVLIVLRRFGLVAPDAYSPLLAYALLALCFLCMMSGGLLVIGDTVVRYRAFRLLYPLWRDLYAATPGIALDPPRSWWSSIAAIFDLNFLLYRRITEIRDGVNALSPFVDTAMVSRVRSDYEGCPPENQRVVAAVLAAAMQAKRSGERAIVPYERPLLPINGQTNDSIELREIAASYHRIQKGSHNSCISRD